MARYDTEYGREYDAWGAGQWGQSAPRGGPQPGAGWYGQGRQGYRGAPRPYDTEFLRPREGYEYEEWGDAFSPGQPRGRDPYGGFTGGGYRTFQRDYEEDYRLGGRGWQQGGRQGGYGASPGGYASTGYPGGYESGYGGGYRTGGLTRGWPERGTARNRVSEIMTENPEVVTPDATLADAAARMKELNVGILPVVESMDNRRLRGVITDRDITIRAVAEGKDGKAKVRDVMTARVESVNKNDGIDRVIDIMEREQVRRVPVTDREGRIVGIIAQADLAVDYAEGHAREERNVIRAIERISEPARPERGESMMQAGGRETAAKKEDRSEKKR